MNVNMNISASIAKNTGDAVGLAVLKKAINIEAQSAMALVNAIPRAPQQSAVKLPPNLGRNINIVA